MPCDGGAGRNVGATAVTRDSHFGATAAFTGLAKWAKAVMLERIQEQQPQVRHVRTSNAFSNAPMLGINQALGFETISAHTEWQAGVDQLLRDLA